jgi:hypothetical protein
MDSPHEDPSNLEALKRRDEALRAAGQRLLRNAQALGEKYGLIMSEVERINQLESPAPAEPEAQQPGVQGDEDPPAEPKK